MDATRLTLAGVGFPELAAVWVLVTLGAAPQGDGAASRPESGPAFREVKGALAGPSYNVKCEGVDAGDLDGDGKVDLAFAAGFVLQPKGMQPHIPQIQMNKSKGPGDIAFADEAEARLPKGFEAQSGSVTAVDLDNDGDVDLFFTQMGGRVQCLLVNDGKGAFAAGGAAFPAIEMSSASSEAGDVDSDGDLDLVLTDQGKPTRLFGNDGKGTFADWTEGRMPAVAVPIAQDATFADVDNDFDLDIVVLGKHVKGQNLFLNDGKGMFTDSTAALSYAGSNNNYEVEWADLDNDTDVDAFWLSLEKQIEGVTKNHFTRESKLAFEHTTAAVAGSTNADDNEVLFIDVDNDGFLDPIVGSLASKTEQVYRNNGDLTFVRIDAFDGQRDPTCDAVAGDFDGDGRMDVATAVGESGTGNKVFRNAGPKDTRAPSLLRHDAPKGVKRTETLTVRLFVQDACYDDGRDFLRGEVSARAPGGAKAAAVMPLTPMGGHLFRGAFDASKLGGAASVTISVKLVDAAGNVLEKELGTVLLTD
jgi:hypothetical protein